jgi:hypothetical protein
VLSPPTIAHNQKALLPDHAVKQTAQGSQQVLARKAGGSITHHLQLETDLHVAV